MLATADLECEVTVTLVQPGTLSTMMREGSRPEHQAAEQSGFMEALMGNRVNQTGYAQYLAMFRPIYAALEEVSEALLDDEIASVVIDSDLYRLPSIDKDLDFWSTWGIEVVDSPAVAAYVTRVHESAKWGGYFLAHHYTRYLGDLSGGQAIGRILGRSFGLEAGEGLAFYEFSGIPKPKIYKDAYRAKLDAIPLSAEDRERVVAEVRSTFGLNQAIFEELGENIDQYARIA